MKRIITLLLISITIGVSAQVSSTFSYDVQLVNPLINADGDTVYTHQCVIEVNDSLNVSAVEFSLGLYPGDTSVVNQLFVVGQNSGLSNGYYVVKGTDEITLGLGSLAVGMYHYRVRLKYLNGASSPYLIYNSATGQYTTMP